MANATVSRFLDINGGGAPFDDLALKVYLGQVLGAYNLNSTTMGRHLHKTITSGKSGQFPVLGRMGTVWHTPGTNVQYQTINSNEKTITIQGLLLAPLFLDILDEAKSHFEVRAEYAKQQGVALASDDDQRVLMAGVAASYASANITGSYGTPAGAQQVAATIGTDAAVLKANIYDCAENMDENNIPASERYIWLAPAQFYLLLQDGEFLDRDFGGEGSRVTARMTRASDFLLVKTNNLPSTNETGDSTFPTNLQRDYSNLVALAAHSSAMGSLTLIGLDFETQWDMDRQGHMLIAKYAKGHDLLRPESAFAFASS